jgi:citrate lyase subunit gamma (acyl carrier protein)
MKIINSAHAGTLESSDVYIQINPLDKDTVEIELESSVKELYGEMIEELIKNTLKDMGVSSVHVKAQDKGAMDLVIKARLQAAILRACECDPVWEELS